MISKVFWDGLQLSSWDETQCLPDGGHGSKPEKGKLPLWVVNELLLQVEKFKNLGVLFMIEGKIDQEIDKWIDSALASMRTLYQTVVVKRELRWKAKLSIYFPIFI